MTRLIALVFAFVLSVIGATAQANAVPKVSLPEKEAGSSAIAATPFELAKLAISAHGGEKLKKMKSLVLRGSADVNSFGQNIPATFVTIIAGDKYYYEINNPFQPLKQIYDGQQTFSSIQGFSLPPITSLGFPLLSRVGDNGYVTTALADTKKKQKGFRITTPDGFYTDFTLDDKTNQLKGYESSYTVGERTVTTSVVIDELITVDGVVVPKKYSQRFDLGQLTAYASFKAKEILINSDVKDDVFAMPK